MSRSKVAKDPRWETSCTIRCVRVVTWSLKAFPLFVLFCVAGSQALAQSTSKSEAGPVIEDQTLRARDGWPIYIKYYQSSLKKEAPVVVLLHKENGNSLVWQGDKGLARSLQERGFAVIAADLRKHGKSKAPGSAEENAANDPNALKPNDYPRMVEGDLEAIKDFIFEEHQKGNLNMRKMAIVGVEMSAPIAINYAVRDWLKKPYDDAPSLAAATPRGQDVQALVLLSPDRACPGVNTTRSLPFLKGREVAALICVGGEDSAYAKDAKLVFQQLGGTTQKEERVYLKKYPVKLRGTDLLGKSTIKVEDLIQFFLEKHVKNLTGAKYEWRDRRSRLQ